MKTNYKSLISIFLLLFVQHITFAQNHSAAASAQKQEVLLIGTFHFNNPGADAVKVNTFDVNSVASQKELEMITDQIKAFHPDKIFVEWDYKDQQGLDSLYNLYTHDEYVNYIKKKYAGKRNYNFYMNSEIVQLAFRAARKSGLAKLNAIDYRMNWPADSAINAMKLAKQDSLLNVISSLSASISKAYNEKMKTMSLTQLMLDLNTPEDRKRNVGFYFKTFNKGGKEGDFAGAFSVSEWYKRNLYMYAQIQKETKTSDKRIMVLLGSGHTAMIKQFIEAEDQLKIVELKDIL